MVKHVCKKVLIIKLGAMGDVLRTTPVLRVFRDTAHITWVVDKQSEEMLRFVGRIDKVIAFDYYTTLKELAKIKYDLIICFDEDPRATSLTDVLSIYHPESRIVSHHLFWCAMSVDNNIKKSQIHTYQHYIFEALGVKWRGQEYVFDWPVTLKRSRPKYVGLETRVGEKWPTKNWTKWKELEQKLKQRGYTVIKFKQKPFWEYVQDINLCDIIVTPDTLTMHLALALKKKVVSLFTSTSEQEIYPYGRMIKVVAPVDCQCCYKRECNKHGIKCANSIRVEDVLNGVRACI